MENAFIKKEKVRFQHVDYAGIVFYPRFLEMLNCLVEDFYEEALNMPFKNIHKTGGIPTVDLKVKFKKAARLGDELTKYFWIKNLGGSSMNCGFKFEHEDGSVCLEGEVTLVKVDFLNDRGDIKSSPFTEEMRGILEKYRIQN
ncbi:acyl-CoA thioesterase [Flavobacterium sp. AG291]|uniref:acyl-CoA thioesterase n=1 Tax=Flavobacterium sp. AG291 TaxID=2184000 RepID=UPI000E0CA84D|nr:thioesterase family protein [Flavobacterium sp. AG291]RDI14329.1 4-hydroxybenzoyl-CoA thioesterase [Flavobacterium sp. AG291]